MEFVATPIDFDTLKKLCREKGLTDANVVEANLVHLCDGMGSKDILMTAEAELTICSAALQTASLGDVDRRLLEAKMFIATMPQQLVGLLCEMAAVGAMDFERGRTNWRVVEDVLLAQDPTLQEQVERKRQAANEPAPGVESEGGTTD